MDFVYGVGIYNKGMTIDGIAASRTKYYATWCGVLARCYSPTERLKNPAYKDCVVSNNWLHFSNFYEWALGQRFFLASGYYLDKDILEKGNKVYDSEMCCIVPREINNLFTKRVTCRGKHPIGVSYHPYNHNYIATITKKGKKVHIGSFQSEVEAFFAYKKVKEEYIKLLADHYRNVLDENVYKSLYNYTVDIED